ncbi:MAG: hypothetical protein EBZ77_16970, partial [Chitinophagia bacterium]|nr:hypothetical protein [Chitinophagia bacterium]
MGCTHKNLIVFFNLATGFIYPFRLMRRFLTLFVGATLSAITASAQKYIGVSTENYSGLNGVYLNPANLADNRYRLTIEIAALNAGVDNDLGKLDIGSGLSKFTSGGTDDLNDVFSYSGKSKFSLLAPYAEVRGPGLTLAI